MINWRYIRNVIKVYWNSLFLIPKYWGRITLSNTRKYMQGNIRLAEFDYLEPHISEQFLFRFSKMNPKCINDGQCPCLCPFPGKQLEDGPCDNDCYGFMLNESEWEIYKIKEGISMRQLKDTYNGDLRKALVK